MNRVFLPLLLVLLGLSSVALAAPRPHADDTDKTAPSYDMKGQSLVDLEQVQKKFVDLANALDRKSVV